MTDIETLEAKRRSLTAQIKAARKKAEAARREDEDKATMAFATWLLSHLYDDDDTTAFDARIDRAKSALSGSKVTEFLRQQVRANGAPTTAPDHEHSESDGGGHHAA